MSILICAATPFEIEPSFSFISEGGRPPSDLLITGVGLMSTAYTLARAISRKRPQLVIQAGIAGALDPSLEPGSVVVVEKELMGDLGVEEGGRFHSVFDMKLVDGNTAPWQQNALINNNDLLNEAGLQKVSSVSVNEISTSAQRIQYYRERLGAQVESMEGAALHYVCLMENIPFLQLRSLSNFVGERDKSKWRMKEAITRLNQELQRIILKQNGS